MDMHDIAEVILLRCPANDLLRYKLVCKSWCSIISTPYFTKSHAKLISDNNEENKTNRKISMLRGPSYYPKELIRNPWLLGWHHYRCWCVGGSSNGLICMFSPSKFKMFLTNPVTRKFKYLELPEVLKSYGSHQSLGFGYVPSLDDYKIVFAILKGGVRAKRGMSVHILSLRETWKDFGVVKYRSDVSDFDFSTESGILVNGALHWFWYNLTKTNIVLVSFDLANEEFREIPQPDDARYVWTIGCRLGTVDGLLCIFPFSEDNEDSDNEVGGIWVMESNNSWKLLPEDHEIQFHVHYMDKDTDEAEARYTPPQTYFCHDNTDLSRSKNHMSCHKFVQTLVSPGDDEDDGSDEATDDEISDNEDDGSDEGSKMKGAQSPKEADTEEGFKKPFKEENPANAATGTNDEVSDGSDEKEDDE